MSTADSLTQRAPVERHLRHVLVGRSRGIAGTVYGTVLVMATIVAARGTGEAGWVLTATVVSSVLVIWIAHVYAHELGESVERKRRPSRRELVEIADRQLPMLTAVVVPTLMLSLGAVGIMQQKTAIWLAMGAGLATLAVQGVRYARIEAMGLLATVAVVSTNLILGAIVIGLKVIAEQ